MLVVEDERGAIAYNSAHSHVRQRFTVAHEIAHFVLHLKRTADHNCSSTATWSFGAMSFPPPAAIMKRSKLTASVRLC